MLCQCPLTCHVATQYVLTVSLLVSVSLSWWIICLCISIHSLDNNSIGDEGAVAISEAMKTMTDIRGLLLSLIHI